MATPPKATKAEFDAKAAEAKKRNADFLRGFLALSTFGTSEIKTGGGEYGDETVADAIFPKTINDIALGRIESRKLIDAQRQAELDAANPGPGPDLADKLVAGAGGRTAARLGQKRGRRSTFLGGGR